MAEKPKTKKAAKPGGSKKTTKKTAAAGTQIGHNSRIDRQKAKEFFDKLDAKHRQKEEDNAGHMADIGALYEKAANALGLPQKIVKKVYKRHRAEMKAQAEYAELETEEKDQFDNLVLAHEFFKSSPLGRAAAERAELRDATGEEDDSALVPDDEEGEHAFN